MLVDLARSLAPSGAELQATRDADLDSPDDSPYRD
jgi:hypothetical protein